MDIVAKEIVGQDDEHGQTKENGGILGTPSAHIATAEEQEKRALHASIVMSTNELKKAQNGLHIGNCANTNISKDDRDCKLIDVHRIHIRKNICHAKTFES